MRGMDIVSVLLTQWNPATAQANNVLDSIALIRGHPHFYLEKRRLYYNIVNMELTSSKLIITDRPLSPAQQISQILPAQQFQSSPMKACLELQQLRSPLIGIVFGFAMGVGMEGLSLDIDVEMVVNKQRIGFKQLTRRDANGYIYRLLELNSCDCFQKPITVLITIKYASSKQYEPIGTVADLARQLSKRSFSLYSQKTFSVVKRQIIIKEPVEAVYRYSELGYIWMKLINRQCALIVQEVRLATWLSANQQCKKFDSTSSLEDSIKLQNGECLSVMLSCPKNINREQLQYWVKYNLPGLTTDQTFKMIKCIYIE